MPVRTGPAHASRGQRHIHLYEGQAARTTATSSSSLLTPNVPIDPPSTSPRLAAKGSWGSSSTTFGGIRPVHLVTIPDLIAGAAIKPILQENTVPPFLNTNSSWAARG